MDRIERMQELKNKGLSYQAIGLVFGISRQRVHQLISGYDKPRKSGQHPNGWYTKIKLSVLVRDDMKCQKCGETDSLTIHHIDGDDRNNDIPNLLTLCNNCHLDLHRPIAGYRNSHAD